MGKFFSDLYSFKGRLGRLGYIGKIIVIIISVMFFGFVGGLLSGIVTPISSALSIGIAVITGLFILSLSFIPPYALVAKRLHDIGISGWWQLVPNVVMIAVLVIAVFSMGSSFVGMNVTSEAELVDALIQGGAGMAQIAIILGFIVIAGFGLMVLFYPGTKGPNKYDEQKPNYSGYTEPKNMGSGLTFLVNFKDPIPEDSMYLIKNIKQSTPGIHAITMPQDRASATIQITNISDLNPKKLKKLFSEIGFPTKSVFQAG